jgi:hypothetical protein
MNGNDRDDGHQIELNSRFTEQIKAHNLKDFFGRIGVGFKVGLEVG